MRKQSLLSSSLQTKRSTPLLSSQNFQLINGRLVSITDNPVSFIQKGYDINDIVYSIIKLVMDKVMIAPWSMYKVKDENAMKAYQGMQKKTSFTAKDLITIRDLHHKALEVVKDAGKWGELLKYPNEYETGPEFIGGSIGYKLLTGNYYNWAEILDGGANKGMPNSLWALPAQFTSIIATDQFPSKVTGYAVQLWGSIPFQTNEVMHGKYWNPNWSINGQQLYGVAPLKAALKILNRDNSSLDASTAAFQNQGIQGILHMKNQIGGADPVEVYNEVKELKKKMVTEWVGEINKGKMGLSGYDMGWLPIGMSAEDMQQIENEKWNLRRFCSVWGVSSRLLNDPDNTAEANVEEAEKSLTTRAALPALTSYRDNLNRKGQKDWGMKPGYIADFDMSVYGELQENTKEMVGWLTPLLDRGLPLNRALELLNIEKINNPYYDLPRVTLAMGQTLEDYEMNPVDQALNDPNADPTNDTSGAAGGK